MGSGNGHELIPSAKRLITSLRDMGYDFAAAVADLIDNSIEARASRVDIAANFMADDSWVRIVDNGRGMKPAELREALRYGAEREYEEGDLGRFGLGLKTASMSQCQRLSIASRTNSDRADIAAYCWDLQHILRSNKWEILPLDRNGAGAVVCEPLLDNRGTSVLWERLDRLLGYDHPYGEFARKRMSAMCRDLEQHLAMVFHRYLAGEVRGRRLAIRLNGNEVKPWDPFIRSERGTRALEAIEFHLEHEGAQGVVRLEPYVLPHQVEFSSPEEFRRASGPSNWNQQQGFYIYRSDRMIQSGGWCRLRTQDEHTKLARVALMFPPKLDSAFKINVSKMRVQLPAQLREQIEEATRPVIKAAQERYRKTSKKHVAIGGYEPAASAGGAHAAKQPEGKYQAERGVGGRTWTLADFAQVLMRSAGAEERRVIARVIERVRKKLMAEEVQ
jgi:hypothetical protein